MGNTAVHFDAHMHSVVLHALPCMLHRCCAACIVVTISVPGTAGLMISCLLAGMGGCSMAVAAAVAAGSSQLAGYISAAWCPCCVGACKVHAKACLCCGCMSKPFCLNLTGMVANDRLPSGCAGPSIRGSGAAGWQRAGLNLAAPFVCGVCADMTPRQRLPLWHSSRLTHSCQHGALVHAVFHGVNFMAW